MKLSVFSLLLAFISFIDFGESKVFSRCGLVKELRKNGFPEHQMRDWVCLVEQESSRDTSKKGGPNKNKSYDHGLFQINDKYWCKNGQKGNDCNAKCEDLRTDDISKACECAKKIHKRHGFSAWYAWKNNCQRSKPDVSKC